MNQTEESYQNLSDEERTILITRYRQGFPPPPGMIHQFSQLMKELKCTKPSYLLPHPLLPRIDEEEEAKSPPEKLQEKPDWTRPVSPTVGESAATVDDATSERAPVAEGAATLPQGKGAALKDEWSRLEADLTEVFEWRRQTWERETQVFAEFEAFLARAGTRGRLHTGPFRQEMLLVQQVRQAEEEVRRRVAREAACAEERAALAEAQRFQEETEAAARQIQAKIDAARAKRYELDGQEAKNYKCHQCGLKGVPRGRECPNRANHRSWR